MGQDIAHVIGKGKRQFRAGGNKLRRNPLDIPTGFANDFKIANNRILNQRVGQESISI